MANTESTEPPAEDIACQLFVDSSVWPELRTWLGARGVNVGLMPPVEDELPAYLATPSQVRGFTPRDEPEEQPVPEDESDEPVTRDDLRAELDEHYARALEDEDYAQALEAALSEVGQLRFAVQRVQGFDGDVHVQAAAQIRFCGHSPQDVVTQLARWSELHSDNGASIHTMEIREDLDSIPSYSVVIRTLF